MIGVATGMASGFFAVDLDLKPGRGDGRATWDQWVQRTRGSGHPPAHDAKWRTASAVPLHTGHG